MTIDQVAQGFTDLRDDRPERFDEMATAVLAYQQTSNSVYARYCKAIGARSGPLPTFLPVEAFKQAAVATFPPKEAEHIFESSRTGRGVPSRHYVRNLAIYNASATGHFRRVFGEGPFLFASYLPGYSVQGGTSSLLYMVEHLIDVYGAEGSGAILYEPTRLHGLAALSRETGTVLIVFGAAFGLLELVESETFSLPDDAVVIETGGMKTHRRTVERRELHGRLAHGFGVPASAVRSEYGMCELLSQCYTRGEGIFFPPPWMRAWVVDPANPFEEVDQGTAGALAVLDLANLYSAAAVLTQDRAVWRGRGFEVLGRLSGAELRGCNFLLEHV